jgi:hypothetical protein
MHADENAVSYFGAWDGMGCLFACWNFCWMLGLRPELFRDSLSDPSPPCQPRAVSLSTVYAKLHNQFPPPFTYSTATSSLGSRLNGSSLVKQTRSCINDAAMLRDRSLSRVIPHLGKMQECGTQSLYRVNFDRCSSTVSHVLAGKGLARRPFT